MSWFKRSQNDLKRINQSQKDNYRSNKTIIQYDIIKEESPFGLLKLNETDIVCIINFLSKPDISICFL